MKQHFQNFFRVLSHSFAKHPVHKTASRSSFRQCIGIISLFSQIKNTGNIGVELQRLVGYRQIIFCTRLITALSSNKSRMFCGGDYPWLLLVITFVLLTIGTSGCTYSALRSRTEQPSKYFRVAGHLNYEYDPGVILPLRNGKILALGGKQLIKQNQEERLYHAEDGKTYGYAAGIAELFDPETSGVKILTKMPFKFYESLGPNRRQMKAIELKDGRIFMVGKFEDNRDVSPEEAKRRYKEWFGKDCRHKLPFFSKIRPDNQLLSMAPCAEPHMFGLIYDWHNHKFEIVNSPDQIPPRNMVTLNLLPDGRVLIIGGSIADGGANRYSGAFPENRVLVFDPKTKKINIAGHLRHTRYGHETIPLTTTQFMLIGGWGVSDIESKQRYCAAYNNDGSCNLYMPQQRTCEVEVFDLKTGYSNIVGHTLRGRYDFSAIPLPNDTVFIHGGEMTSLMPYLASELYNQTTGKTIFIGEAWDPKILESGPPVYREFPCRMTGEGIDNRSILTGGVILICGEDFAQIYDWHSLSQLINLKHPYIADRLLVSRTNHHLVKTPSGRVFVIGGRFFKYAPMSNALRRIPDFFKKHRSPSQVDIEEFVFPAKLHEKES